MIRLRELSTRYVTEYLMTQSTSWRKKTILASGWAGFHPRCFSFFFAGYVSLGDDCFLWFMWKGGGKGGGIDMQWKEHIIFVLGRNEVQDYYMQKLSNESYCVSLFT